MKSLFLFPFPIIFFLVFSLSNNSIYSAHVAPITSGENKWCILNRIALELDLIYDVVSEIQTKLDVQVTNTFSEIENNN